MTEEKKNMNEIVDGAEVRISGITMRMEKEEIAQVRFQAKTNDEEFEITWKPKVTKITKDAGIDFETESRITRDEVPQLLRDIAKKIQQSKECKLKASYQIFSTVKDDVLKEYRYIPNLKTFEQWEILN